MGLRTLACLVNQSTQPDNPCRLVTANSLPRLTIGPVLLRGLEWLDTNMEMTPAIKTKTRIDLSSQGPAACRRKSPHSLFITCPLLVKKFPLRLCMTLTLDGVCLAIMNQPRLLQTRRRYRTTVCLWSAAWPASCLENTTLDRRH